MLGALPRGKHAKPLVSEFGAYITAVCSVQCASKLQFFLKDLPEGASIQSRLLSTWGVVREAIVKQTKKTMLEKKLNELKESSNGNIAAPDPYVKVYKQFGCLQGTTYRLLVEDHEELNDDEACEKITIAIPREPMDFLCRAVAVGHPRGVALQVPSALKEVVEWNRDADAFTTYKHRIEFVKHWANRAKELSAEYMKLLEQALPHLQKLLV